MPFHSSILSSKYFLRVGVVIIFLTPWLFAQFVFYPKASGRFQEMQKIEQEWKRDASKEFLLVGDSTARNIHSWSFWNGIATRSEGPDDSWLNLGLGGASFYEWRSLVAKAMKKTPSLKKVAVVASPASYLSAKNSQPGPYVSYIYSWYELFQMWRKSEIGFFILMNTYLMKLFPLHLDRNEIIFYINQSEWAKNLVFKKNNPRDANNFRVQKKSPTILFKDLVLEAEKNKASTVFFLSPTRSDLRNGDPQKLGAIFFSDICGGLGLRCVDLSRDFSDESFYADGAHLKPEFQQKFLKMIEKSF